jgi:hypothetical protein
MATTQIDARSPVQRWLQSRNAPIVIMVIGICVEWVAAMWDIAYHFEIGRDRFLTPPHAAMVAGGVILGLGAVPFRAAAARPGVRVASAAAALQGLSLLIDNWWHNTFGVDVTLWSPPHVALIVLWWIAMVALMADYMRGDDPNPVVLAAWSGLFLATTTIMLSEYDFGGPHFRVLWEPALLAALTLGGLFLARRASDLWFGATLAGVVAVGARLVPLAVNASLHRATPGVPIGIIAAGIAVDAVFVIGPHLDALAAAAGTAALIVVEIPWLHATARVYWPNSLLTAAVFVGAAGGALGALVGAGLGDRLHGRRFRGPGRVAAIALLVVGIVVIAPLLDRATPQPSNRLGTITLTDSTLQLTLPGVTERDWVSVFTRASGERARKWRTSLSYAGHDYFTGRRPKTGDRVDIWVVHGDSSWNGARFAPPGNSSGDILLQRNSAHAPGNPPPWLTPFAYGVVVVLLAGGALAARRALDAIA